MNCIYKIIRNRLNYQRRRYDVGRVVKIEEIHCGFARIAKKKGRRKITALADYEEKLVPKNLYTVHYVYLLLSCFHVHEYSRTY